MALKCLDLPAQASNEMAVATCCSRTPNSSAMRRLIGFIDGGATVAGFYERNGAVRIGEAPSDAVSGRLLPLYELRLTPRGPS